MLHRPKRPDTFAMSHMPDSMSRVCSSFIFKIEKYEWDIHANNLIAFTFGKNME